MRGASGDHARSRPDERALRHAGNARSRGARARAARAAAARRSRTRRRTRRRSRASSPASMPAAVTSREALAPLPVDAQVRAARAAEAPSARSAASPRRAGARRGACSRRPARSTSPKARAPDYWRLARALFAAGFRAGDLVHNCFSYHFTPAGSMLETGAHALGCTVFPGGTGQTEQQVQAMADLRPTATSARRRSCKIILEKADEHGRRAADASTKALRVRPSRFRRALRDALAARGIAGYQVYATRRPRRDRLRDAGARRARRRRRRAGRDRAARHRRSGRAGRSRRSRRDARSPTPTIR